MNENLPKLGEIVQIAPEGKAGFGKDDVVRIAKKTRERVLDIVAVGFVDLIQCSHTHGKRCNTQSCIVDNNQG